MRCSFGVFFPSVPSSVLSLGALCALNVYLFLSAVTSLLHKHLCSFAVCYSASANLEAEPNIIYSKIDNAVDKQYRKDKIKRLIVKCKEAFPKVVDEIEELYVVEQKTEYPNAACKNLEK